MRSAILCGAVGRALAGGLLAAACAGAASATAFEEQRAATCWVARHRGFEATGRVDPAPVRCAIEGFGAAAAAAPERLEPRFREIEALWFAAHFVRMPGGEARTLLDRCVEVAEGAVAEVARRAGGAALDPGADFELRAAALAPIPGAGAAHFWAAIAWGEWALQHGALAALARGVPTRLRRHAELAARLAPGLRDGGGLRLLGRLHASLPRIPGLTGWVDRARGVELLREAAARWPGDPRNRLFLAEALLERDPSSSGEALALLEDLANDRADPEERVEQAETLHAAADLLRRLSVERAR